MNRSTRDEMPPLDLDSVMVFGESNGTEDDHDDPYAPAESLRLRIGEDIAWSDVVVVGGGGAVLRRDDSTKGAGANPKSAARRKSAQQPTAAPSSRSSMSAAAPTRKVVPVVIGGLMPPATAGKARCSPCRLGARVFAAGEQQAVDHHLEEPGSPKVSCLGAVRPEHRRPTGRRRTWCRSSSWFATSVTSCCFSSHRS